MAKFLNSTNYKSRIAVGIKVRVKVCFDELYQSMSLNVVVYQYNSASLASAIQTMAPVQPRPPKKHTSATERSHLASKL